MPGRGAEAPGPPSWSSAPPPSPPPWGVFSNSPTGGAPPHLPPGPALLPTFTHLDPSSTGWLAAPALIAHWEALGVVEPARVLVELGLHNATLDTVEVSRLLQEEVAQASEVLTFPTVQAGLLTMQVRSEANGRDLFTKFYSRLRPGSCGALLTALVRSETNCAKTFSMPTSAASCLPKRLMNSMLVRRKRAGTKFRWIKMSKCEIPKYSPTPSIGVELCDMMQRIEHL